MSQPWSRSRNEYVARMFGEIADRYDLMNRIMTLGRDRRWREQAADVANLRPGSSVLDVASGTGDLAFALARRVVPGGQVAGLDIAEPMLQIARRKAVEQRLPVAFQLGNAFELPFPDQSFDAVTCAFGLRNMEDRLAALKEFLRVTRPGGRVVILELTPAQNELTRAYMDKVIPRLGELIAGAREAYTYLPASVQEFPGPRDLAQLMYAAGARKVTYRLLNFGTVALHWATR